LKNIVKVVYLKIIFILIILCSLSFTQFRIDYEIQGKFNKKKTDGAVLVGYDFIKWKQKSVNSGIGFNISLNESPDDMRFNSLYCIVNYNVEEQWNMYSKVGITHLMQSSLLTDPIGYMTGDDDGGDEYGVFIGIGANYNFNDKFHIELGYHLSLIDNHDLERFVISYIKHFEMDK